jgi:hypothetical protein
MINGRNVREQPASASVDLGKGLPSAGVQARVPLLSMQCQMSTFPVGFHAVHVEAALAFTPEP